MIQQITLMTSPANTLRHAYSATIVGHPELEQPVVRYFSRSVKSLPSDQIQPTLNRERQTLESQLKSQSLETISIAQIDESPDVADRSLIQRVESVRSIKTEPESSSVVIQPSLGIERDSNNHSDTSTTSESSDNSSMYIAPIQRMISLTQPHSPTPAADSGHPAKQKIKTSRLWAEFVYQLMISTIFADVLSYFGVSLAAGLFIPLFTLIAGFSCGLYACGEMLSDTETYDSESLKPACFRRPSLAVFQRVNTFKNRYSSIKQLAPYLLMSYRYGYLFGGPGTGVSDTILHNYIGVNEHEDQNVAYFCAGIILFTVMLGAGLGIRKTYKAQDGCDAGTQSVDVAEAGDQPERGLIDSSG